MKSLASLDGCIGWTSGCGKICILDKSDMKFGNKQRSMGFVNYFGFSLCNKWVFLCIVIELFEYISRWTNEHISKSNPGFFYSSCWWIFRCLSEYSDYGWRDSRFNGHSENTRVQTPYFIQNVSQIHMQQFIDLEKRCFYVTFFLKMSIFVYVFCFICEKELTGGWVVYSMTPISPVRLTGLVWNLASALCGGCSCSCP